MFHTTAGRIRSVDFVQVNMVLSVARNGSFSAAAKELSYSQSTISKRIDALEKEIGIRLFERSGRSQLALTDEGRELICEFEAIESAYGELSRHIDMLRDSQCHDLRLGIVDGLSTFGEDELIIAFEKAHPHVAMSQRLGNNARLFQLLRSRQIDAAIVALLDAEEQRSYDDGSVVFHDMWDLDLKIAIRTDHPAIDDGKVALASLKDESFLFRSFHEGMKTDPKIRRFVSACESEGFEPNLQFSTDRKTMVLNMVATGQCVAPLMYRPMILMKGLEVLPLDKSYYGFSIKLAYLRSNDNRTLPLFLNFLDEHIASLQQTMR